MKKVLILGATGMLGNALYKVLRSKYHLILGVRNVENLALLDKVHGDVAQHRVIPFDASLISKDFIDRNISAENYLSSFLKDLGEIDYVINAIGITIPFAAKDALNTYFINTALPHILATAFGDKLIHITTDCVYNGKEDFPYDENSVKTPVDLYGLTKHLGEPTTCLTIRTSIIGRELTGLTGLLEWFLQQRGKEISGFANHFWNGVTTIEFAKLCDRIMENPDKFYKKGIYHIFSTSISKLEMLSKFEEKYKIGCGIIPNYQNSLNRTLSTIYNLKNDLYIHSFDEMLKEI